MNRNDSWDRVSAPSILYQTQADSTIQVNKCSETVTTSLRDFIVLPSMISRPHHDPLQTISISGIGTIFSLRSLLLADSLTESNRPTQNDSSQSRSTPSSDFPPDRGEHRGAKEEKKFKQSGTGRFIMHLSNKKKSILPHPYRKKSIKNILNYWACYKTAAVRDDCLRALNQVKLGQSFATAVRCLPIQ